MRAKARFSRSAAPRRSSGDVRASGASSHRPGAFLALPVALLAALLALLALAASSASAAAPELPFLETFGSAAQPSFTERLTNVRLWLAGAERIRLRLLARRRLTGIAVDQTTGDVYVTDQANNRIDEFSVVGSFVRAFGWDVVFGASA
jgi:NHL repeat